MKRVSVRVRGIVQGVGFRPFVQRAALARGLVGAVRNDGVGVEIDAQGDEASVDAFVEALRSEAPPAATVVEVNVEPRAAGGASRFGIEVSEPGMRVRPTLPADLAPCEQCSAEVAAPGDRRHGHPFTNCTQCGPRYTIATGLPYDRACTTMQGFALCGDCAREYADPSDRRYHAEPIACSRCGPKLFFAGGSSDSARGPEALHRAVDALLGGRIVALKGVGGYQLACDATNAESVACLRARKRRPDKPFALMFASPRAVREHAELSGDEERLLASQRAPIVLLRRRPGDRALAPGVAGRGPWLGAMLPSSPMHRLLLDRLARPMVCTSGNAAEEPICIDDEEAKERLRGITDAWLLHDSTDRAPGGRLGCARRTHRGRGDAARARLGSAAYWPGRLDAHGARSGRVPEVDRGAGLWGRRRRQPAPRGFWTHPAPVRCWRAPRQTSARSSGCAPRSSRATFTLTTLRPCWQSASPKS